MEKNQTEPGNAKLELLNLYIHTGRLVTFSQETVESFDYEDLIDCVVSKLGKGAIVAPPQFSHEIYQLADRDRCAIIRINYE